MGCRPTDPTKLKQFTIPLLLISIELLSHLSAFAVLAAPPPPTMATFDRYVEREKESAQQHFNGRGTSANNVVRHYRLHNRCSGRHVLVKGRVVHASGTQNNDYALLRVETSSFESRVRIQSAVTRDYLCFNKQGKLTVRHSGNGKRCQFRELHADNDFTEFQSVANRHWLIGFKANGQRLDGSQWRTAKKDVNIRRRHPKSSARQCYQFIKTDFAHIGHMASPTGEDSSDSQRGPWASKLDLSQWFAKIMSTTSPRTDKTV